MRIVTPFSPLCHNFVTAPCHSKPITTKEATVGMGKKLWKWRWFLLASMLVGINGLWAWQATHDGSLRVERFEAGDHDIVDLHQKLTWRFSGQMVDTGTVGKVTSAAPVELSPPVIGHFRWESTRELSFQPADPWPACTRFVTTLKDDLTDTAGHYLTGTHKYPFASPRLAVIDVREINVEHSQSTIAITFNSRPEISSLHERIKIRVGRHNQWYRVEGSGANNRVILRATLPAEAQATLHLAAGIRPHQGELNTLKSSEWPITRSKKLTLSRLRGFSPAFGDGQIQLHFNRPLKSVGIHDLVSVAPTCDYRVQTSASRWGAGLTLVGDFQPGRSYTITLHPGIRARGGAVLEKEGTHHVLMPNRPAGLTINTTGNYLSPRGSMQLPIQTVNVPTFTVRANRVEAHNLVQFLMRHEDRYDYHYRSTQAHRQISRIVGARHFTPPHTPDTPQQTIVDLRELLGQASTGIYQLTATAESKQATHLLVVSDIGISVKRSSNDLLVWVNQLHSLAPVSNATVEIHAADGSRIATAATDGDGIAHIKQLFNGADIPFAVTVQKGDDLSYLSLDRTAVPLNGELGGAPYAGSAGEIHLYTDRGIYRPGETVHIVAIRRDGALEIPTSPTPLAFTLQRPDGGRFSTADATPDENGMATWDVVIPESAHTGKYVLKASLPEHAKTVGTLTFLVEAFMPPQIAVSLKTAPASGTSQTNAPARLAGKFGASLSSRFLIGRVAADLPASLYATLKPVTFSPSGWQGYHFYDAEKAAIGTRGQWVGRGRLDAAGKASFDWTIPPLEPRSAMQVVLCGTVTEPSGRAVSDYQALPVDCYPRYVGIARPTRGTTPRAGTPMELPIAAVRPDGSTDTAPLTLSAELLRIEWHSTYARKDNGNYRYKSERILHSVQREEVQLAKGTGIFTCTAATAGSYLVRVTDTAGGASSALPLYVSAHGQAWVPVSQERPGHLELSLDRDHYQIGQTARLTIKAPFAGKALISIESDRVLHQQILSLAGNTGSVDIPVPAEALPNAYCSVVLIRPVEVPHGEPSTNENDAIWMPHRAIGTLPLMVRDTRKQLRVAVTAPSDMPPQTALPIQIQVTQNKHPVPHARVTIAVVDEAICMLTRFKTPNPFAFFTRKRALAVKLSDLYGLLMPELAAAVVGSPSTAAGDAPSSLASRLNPIKARRYTPMVRWVGELRTDSNGVAQTTISMPEFSGKVRIMAVAAAPAGVGASAAHTIVKRPITVTAGLPRFLAPGDSCDLPVSIYNDSDSAALVTVEVDTTGPVALTGAARTSRVMPQASTTLVMRATAQQQVGVATIRIRASTTDAPPADAIPTTFYEETIELAVRPPFPRITRGQLVTVEPGEKQALELAGNWLAGTSEHRVWCSPLPSVKLSGSLDYLLRYPYGCLEQTTSRAFPLLYLADLLPVGGTDGITQDHTRPMVEAGIRRIQTMQFHDGGFSYWPRSQGRYEWGTHYATHFLVEAESAGYRVDSVMLQRALTYIEARLAQGLPTDLVHGADIPNIRTRAYGCYILALAGKRPHAWVTRLTELVRSGTLSDLESMAYLAAAQTALGMRRDAGLTIKRVSSEPPQANDTWRTWGTLSSSTKTEALLLSAWLDINPRSPQVALLAKRIETRQRNGRYRSTQENAMVLLALGKYGRWLAKAAPHATGTATWDALKNHVEHPIDAAHPLQTNLPATVSSITIQATDQGPLYCWLQSSGVPLVGPPRAVANGLTIARHWFNSEGHEISPDDIRRGDLVVVRLQIRPSDKLRNLVITDLLPAGLEIENARLSTSQTLPWAKKRTDLPVLHMDVRDDRLLLFIKSISQPREFYYVTRAVTAGTFTVPPAAAECMYDASLNAISTPNQRMVIR
jgi:uncharacterized protein YfaS (alpha-2-macroglobulin family)